MPHRKAHWPTISSFAVVCVVSAVALAQRPSVHDFAWAGSFARVKSLIEADPALLTAQDDLQQIPLHLAARGGHPEMVKYLLERGSPVNLQAYNQFTPLHLTSNGEVARMLLEAGADVTLQRVGDSALLRAATERRVQVVRALLEHGE
jgi:ankyrin repeat protein